MIQRALQTNLDSITQDVLDHHAGPLGWRATCLLFAFVDADHPKMPEQIERLPVRRTSLKIRGEVLIAVEKVCVQRRIYPRIALMTAARMPEVVELYSRIYAASLAEFEAAIVELRRIHGD